MASEIRNTFTQPIASPGTGGESFLFTIFSKVFPDIAVTVTREAIEEMASGNGLGEVPVRTGGRLQILSDLQPEFVALAVDMSGGRDRVMITAADVAEYLR